LPGLCGGHESHAARDQVAGRRQAAAGAGPVVAGAAAAGLRRLDVLQRRPFPRAAAPPRGGSVMGAFPKIHDLHVARVVVVTLLLVWAVLVGLDAVLAVVNEIENVGQGNYGFVSVLTYVAYSLPRRAYTMFPTAAVIGTLMGLGQ